MPESTARSDDDQWGIRPWKNPKGRSRPAPSCVEPESYCTAERTE